MADSSHYSWAKLVNGDSVETSPDQFLIWSETGKRLELWGPRQSGGLLYLIKYWHRKSILWHGGTRNEVNLES